MRIAIDISPLKSGHFLQHRVRGTGFYINNLVKALKEYHSEHEYILFQRGEELPKKIDLIHYPYFEPFFLTLPLVKSVPSVVTVHDFTPFVFPEHFPSGARGNIKWQIQKFSLLRMDAVIADSESSKKDIQKYAGISLRKISVVYLAADRGFSQQEISQRTRDEFLKKYKLPEKFVLYVGDATWNKNVPRLLRATKKAQLPIVLTGKAHSEKQIDAANPWNADLLEVQRMSAHDPDIYRLGFVSFEDLRMLYNIATVFAMPSLYEGFGLPVLEAMQSGCPVVTTSRGSIPEIGKDAVYYVDPENEEHIAEGIVAVFHDDKMQRSLREKGLEQARKFSWKKTAEQTITVYRSLLEE